MFDRFGALMRVTLSALRGKSFCWLNAADRARSANALDDASFLKWGRWATAIVEHAWMQEADKKGRGFDEVLVMHSVVGLARMVLRSGQARLIGTVNGVTYAGKDLGDWQVIIERVAAKGSTANAIDGNRDELLDQLLAQIDVWPGSIDGRDMLATHNTANLLRDLWHAIELLKRTLGYRDCQIKALHQVVAERDAEIERLKAERDRPETQDWLRGVMHEAAHQRARWGEAHDAGKSPFDWFWLLGYLGQKAADSALRGDNEKALHHTISTAAALANWHLAIIGRADGMRPGIAVPAEYGEAHND